MIKYDLLVIGGDAGGMSAASQARRIDKNISIGVLNKGEHVSFAACGMPYFISGDVGHADDLKAINPDDFMKKRNIQIFVKHEALRIDFMNRIVTIQNEKGAVDYGYGKLVIATGATPIIPPITGVDSENVFFLRNLSDGIAIQKYIAEKKPKKGIIIGGGFIGLEMSEALRKLSIETTLLEREESVALTMSPDVRQIILDELAAYDVAVRTGTTVESISRDGDRLIVSTASEKYEAEFVIVSTGVRPATEFLKETELAMTDFGAIVVNEKSETNITGVYSAGDCATVINRITGKTDYMPLGTTANKQGRVAGLQAVGIETEIFPGIVGSQQVKVFGLEIGKTGFNRADAERAGIPSETGNSSWNSRAGYYPGSEKVHVLITINSETRKVIGGEVIGRDGAAHRSNFIAMAVATGLTVEELAYMDLGYAPPFSPVWDPINSAAQVMVTRERTRGFHEG